MSLQPNAWKAPIPGVIDPARVAIRKDGFLSSDRPFSPNLIEDGVQLVCRLVLVEGGIIAVLVFFGLTASQALSVAILDRLISYWSLIAVGLVVFLLSHRR